MNENKIISEDYVSFETAKLLKEKGFDEFCRAHYDITNGNLYYEKVEVEASGCEMHNSVLAPTLQMTMKWLRKMHNLHIDAPITYQYFPKKYEAHIMHTEKYEDIVVNPGTNFNTYEDACEAAIKYCLENLI